MKKPRKEASSARPALQPVVGPHGSKGKRVSMLVRVGEVGVKRLRRDARQAYGKKGTPYRFSCDLLEAWAQLPLKTRKTLERVAGPEGSPQALAMEILREWSKSAPDVIESYAPEDAQGESAPEPQQSAA